MRSQATRSTFGFQQSDFGGQKRGSKVAHYKKTVEDEFGADKLVSISVIPVYKAKSHEELRWEDHQLTGKGGFGLNSSAVETTPSGLFPFSSSTFSNFSTPSLGTTSILHFTNPFTSPATQTSYSSNFEAFTGHQPMTPSSLNAGPFVSTVPTAAASVAVSSGLSSTFNQQTPLFKPIIHTTQNFNWAIPGINGQGSAAQLSSSQITSSEKTSSAANPFGTLPPKPHMFLEGSRSTPPIQYGISSIRVQDKPVPVRSLSLLRTRHLSRRCKVRVQKYDPKLNGLKIPYLKENEIPVDVFVPRENPRALVLCPEKWSTRDKIHEEKFYESESGGVVIEEEKQVLSNVPSKLEQRDYYTKPEISELEAKERSDPGFCSRVKEFVIGRHGYGSIKFLGETDVRKLLLEACVKFNNREVIVYMNESKKPPVGEGLNKVAEVTLLNIKCLDKTSGMQCTDGWKIDKYREMLKKKAAAQGAEFVSYDPVRGEWKFRVQHF